MSDLEAKVQSITNHDRSSTLLEDKISQSFETLTDQLTISNAEVANCISHLFTRVTRMWRDFEGEVSNILSSDSLLNEV